MDQRYKIRDTKVRDIKLLVENTVKLHDLAFGNTFLDITPKV